MIIDRGATAFIGCALITLIWAIFIYRKAGGKMKSILFFVLRFLMTFAGGVFVGGYLMLDGGAFRWGMSMLKKPAVVLVGMNGGKTVHYDTNLADEGTLVMLETVKQSFVDKLKASNPAVKPAVKK